MQRYCKIKRLNVPELDFPSHLISQKTVHLLKKEEYV